MSGLAGDGAKRLLGECGLTNRPRMLRTGHTQTAGARGGVVARSSWRAVGDVQESVGGRFGVVMVRRVMVGVRPKSYQGTPELIMLLLFLPLKEWYTR